MSATFAARAAPASNLSFTLSRGQGRMIMVTEAAERSGGAFADLSAAMRFVATQCAAKGCAVRMRFDASLAMIRSAGA